MDHGGGLVPSSGAFRSTGDWPRRVMWRERQARSDLFKRAFCPSIALARSATCLSNCFLLCLSGWRLAGFSRKSALACGFLINPVSAMPRM